MPMRKHTAEKIINKLKKAEVIIAAGGNVVEAARCNGVSEQTFYRGRTQGLWDRVLATEQRKVDAPGEVDWKVHLVDGTNVRAHQHAARAKGGIATRR